MTEYDFDYPQVAHPALTAFAERAREFCAVVDCGLAEEDVRFASQLHRVLAQLYSAGLDLPSTDMLWDLDKEEIGQVDDASADHPHVDDPGPDPDRLSTDGLRALCRSLAQRFGASNYYREVFDPYEAPEEAEVTGSLTDDVADIYHDIRAGLMKWDRGESGEALWEWRFHLEIHWGEHATGALRALHARAAWWDGAWPAGDPGAGSRGA